MGRLWTIAFRNLRQAGRRTLLLGGAIAGVTLMLVALTSVANGIQDTMLRAVTTMATGHVNVAGFFKITSGQASPIVADYEPLLDYVLEEVPEAEHVVDRLRGWGKVVSPASSLQVGFNGVDVEREPGLQQVLQVMDGKLDDLRGSGTVMLFERQAERLEVKVGDGITISAPTVRGSQNSLDLEVVAIARDIGFMSGWSVFVPKDVVREIYLLGDNSTGAIQIYLKDPDQAVEIAERLRAEVAALGHGVMEPLGEPFWKKFPVVTREAWTGQKIDVTSWEDEMAFVMWTTNALDAITGVLVGILIVIILVGLMNTMWMTIRERTQEIGTLRAIGMQRGRVMWMFVLEAGLLSALASATGAVLGTVLCTALNAAEIPVSEGFSLFLMRETLRMVVDPGSVIRAVVVISSITTIFSCYPAYRAARLPPITAIHQVG